MYAVTQTMRSVRRTYRSRDQHKPGLSSSCDSRRSKAQRNVSQPSSRRHRRSRRETTKHNTSVLSYSLNKNTGVTTLFVLAAAFALALQWRGRSNAEGRNNVLATRRSDLQIATYSLASQKDVGGKPAPNGRYTYPVAIVVQGKIW